MNYEYDGNVESWIDFITSWQKIKNINLSVERNYIDYEKSFSIDLPGSYKHFMAAAYALNCTDLLGVFTVDSDAKFYMLKQDEIDGLCFVDSLGSYVLKYPEGETLPMILSSAYYRNYSRSQDNLSFDKAKFCSWVVGRCSSLGGMIYLLLNPIVRFPGGEWEACYY